MCKANLLYTLETKINPQKVLVWARSFNTAHGPNAVVLQLPTAAKEVSYQRLIATQSNADQFKGYGTSSVKSMWTARRLTDTQFVIVGRNQFANETVGPARHTASLFHPYIHGHSQPSLWCIHWLVTTCQEFSELDGAWNVLKRLS
jgi:hypothetical protein